MKEEDLEEESDSFSARDIVNNGDSIRQRILDKMNVDISQTTPNVFNYTMHKNSIGLNEISNVDMGYSCTTIGTDDEKLSKRNPYLNELEYNVSLMKESDNAIVVLNGGLFTYIPKTRNGEMLSYEEQIGYFYSLFKDLANEGKIVAMVRGTEEHRILKNQRIDVYGILQEALGISGKVCNDALINVAVEDDMVGNANVGIRTINWNNTATTGAYIGRKMEERATKRSGADIYLARTTMGYFKSAMVGESVNGKKVNKPIFLISGGSYTSFKGAMTAGAEYNSIKDNELAPNSFWYKVTVEQNKDATEGERPYLVRVNPINYIAHQVNFQGTDKVTAEIESRISETTDSFVQQFVDRYPDAIKKTREDGRKAIRETLIANRAVSERNDDIKEYIKFKKGEKLEENSDVPLEFEGSNVPEVEAAEVFDDFNDDQM